MTLIIRNWLEEPGIGIVCQFFGQVPTYASCLPGFPGFPYHAWRWIPIRQGRPCFS